MIFSEQIISQLRIVSGLRFDKASDFAMLSEQIYLKTKKTIGETTIKRLFGYIKDQRNTNQSTLNIIAEYLGYPSWSEFNSKLRIDSDWNPQLDTIWIEDLKIGTSLEISYLNRTVQFRVVESEGKKILKVENSVNSSLKIGDLAFIDKIIIGECIYARTVYRGDILGSYKTNGEVKNIKINQP